MLIPISASVASAVAGASSENLSDVPLKLVVLPVVTVAVVPAALHAIVIKETPFFLAVKVAEPVAATAASP